MKAQLFSILLMSTLFFFGCVETSLTGSSKDTVTTLSIRANSTQVNRSGEIELQDKVGNAITLSEAKLAVRHVEFVMENDSSYKITGPFVVDLLSGVTTPEISSTEIPLGAYKRIDVRIDDSDEDFTMISSNDSLYEYSLYAKGMYEEREFIMKLKFNEDVRFDFAAPLSVLDIARNDFVLTLTVSEWFSLLDLTECIAAQEKMDIVTVVDDEEWCSDIEGDLKETIKNLYDFSSDSDD